MKERKKKEEEKKGGGGRKEQYTMFMTRKTHVIKRPIIPKIYLQI